MHAPHISRQKTGITFYLSVKNLRLQGNKTGKQMRDDIILYNCYSDTTEQGIQAKKKKK